MKQEQEQGKGRNLKETLKKGIFEEVDFLRFKKSEDMENEELQKVLEEEIEIESKIYEKAQKLFPEGVENNGQALEVLKRLSPEDQLTFLQEIVPYGLKYLYEEHYVIDGTMTPEEYRKLVKKALKERKEG